MNNELKYPIFQECSGYTLDEYWKNIFCNCAQGKFPRGFYVITSTSSGGGGGGNNHIKVGKEIFEFKDDPKEMTKVCMNIFKTNLKLKSEKDKEELNTEFKQVQENLVHQHNTFIFGGWKEVKPKTLKEMLINDYIIKLQKKYKFTDEEVVYLQKLIHVGFILKILQNDDVDYDSDNGIIKKIDGLIINSHESNIKLKFKLKGDINIDERNLVTTSGSNNQKKNPFIVESKKYFKE